MGYEDYNCLKVRAERGVAFVTIDNPPINILTIELAGELSRLADEIAADDDVRVVVFDSADPDFFIAHFDVSLLVELPDEPPPK
ncbi:MAG: enoyl-CoA hydratase/isomerase family protein, partial [Deltaproteobacteria bacterium]|nr:enoyl-CoA hydratase/isomerase family protein [Deltaproteobacteria bacterium]